MSEDTYTGDKNDPLSLNLYTYCHNEPVMYVDPTGHTESCDSKLSSDDKKRIAKLTADYNTAMKKGNLQAAEDAHRAAVAIRESSGRLNNYVDGYNYKTEEKKGGSSTVSKGSEGSNVTAVQKALKRQGYNLGSTGADGDFGTYTEGAVVRYQIDNGLYYDGIVGKNTSASLGVTLKNTNDIASKTSSQTIKNSKSNSLPKEGEPNSKGTLYNPDGSIKQEREYGPDGKPLEDTDYNHGGTGHVFPHKHPWEDGVRQDGIPVTPKPSPAPVMQNQNTSNSGGITAGDVGKAAVVAGGTVAVGYIIYRGIRMLPSLIPALWWTIPANVALP